MVFYRKYRPQNIDELDSTSVRETLHAVLQKNIPHAFLFTGPKGLGKTSTARIVAKVVNCETPKNKRKESLEPCNTCNQCVSVTNGSNVDILEIDAASNRGIDEIRELKEKIRLAPVAATRKVYIIDEVHMLTTEAFNALLKTLEEPPEHAMFILCTTEAHKVPETIVSRCFQIMFQLAKDIEISRSLGRIKKEEKIDIDDGALANIAEVANGSFRDATKILEEMVMLAAGKKIDNEFINKNYHKYGLQVYIKDFLIALAAKNTKDVLGYIAGANSLGTDMKYLLGKLMEALHELLLQKIDSSNISKYAIPIDTYSLDEIKLLVELLSKAYVDMKTAVLPQLPLELAVIEWCEQEEQNKPKAAVIASIRQPAETKQSHGGDRHSASGRIAMTNDDTEVSVSSLRKQVGTIKKLKALYGEKKSEPQEEEVIITTTSVELMHANSDGTVTKEWMELFWKNLISEMKKYNHTVAGVLRGCTIKTYADQQLVIQTAYKFHKERLDDMKNREALLRIAKLLTGKDIAITVELRKSV